MFQGVNAARASLCNTICKTYQVVLFMSSILRRRRVFSLIKIQLNQLCQVYFNSQNLVAMSLFAVSGKHILPVYVSCSTFEQGTNLSHIKLRLEIVSQFVGQRYTGTKGLCWIPVLAPVYIKVFIQIEAFLHLGHMPCHDHFTRLNSVNCL